MTGERLRLRAVDADDLRIIAACLQDALIPLAEMAYLADQARFVAAFTRFRRECVADPERCDHLTQVQSALTFDEVVAVKYRGLDSRLGRLRQELLTILVEPAADGLIHVTLVFAGDAAIQLQLRRIAARLEDFGEPQPAHAAPRHELQPSPGEEA
jgi:hypothetical protein